jgi:hypothetical protein
LVQRKVDRSANREENRYHVREEGPERHDRASPMGKTVKQRDSSR